MKADHNEKEIKDFVKKRYSKLAKRGCACSENGSTCCMDVKGSYAQKIGYQNEELKDLPDTVLNTVAGCGNPTALADLKKGNTVLDLGSGGGIDAFLAAKKVGVAGKVIGVDMTDDMIKLANENKKKMDVKNVEFRLGEIENLPVEDNSVDVIISNCVINLSTNKDRVFEEAFRVLKPGGRVLVSDVVTQDELPDEIRRDPEMWAGCIAGALKEEEYLQKMINAGFKNIHVLLKQDFKGIASSIKVKANKPLN